MLPETLPYRPLVVGVVVVVVAAALTYQRTLTWAEYKRLHGSKRLLAPTLDKTPLFAVSDKRNYRANREYLATVDASVQEVFETLTDAGGSPHLLNSVKRRRNPSGVVEYSDAHVLWLHNGFEGDQTEVYLWNNGDGTSDVYCHFEPSVLDPDAHLDGDNQQDGDPRGVVWDALEDAYGITAENK